MNANVSIYQDSVKDSSGILTSESNEMGLSTIFNYNGNNVAFIKTSYGILINATDMARPYNKRPVDYLRQIYVNELVSTIVSQTHISEDQLVIKMRGSSENGGGTWLYEDVAIDFAQMNITYIIDIQVITLTIIPIFLGIGSILLNVKIMYINVFILMIYDIFLYS